MPRTVLITGASRGLGIEFVRQLRAAGDTVIAGCRSGREPDLTAAGAEVIQLDVTDAAHVQRLPAMLVGRPIDALINNAGVSSDARTIAEVSAHELTRVFTVNSIAPLTVAKALLPNLRAGRGKAIFNITSQLASLTNNTSGGSSYAYRASKAALNMLTLQLAHELGREGFCCVMVHPGWVRTDMGGAQAPLSPEKSVSDMVALLASLTPAMNGKFLNHDGAPMPW